MNASARNLLSSVLGLMLLLSVRQAHAIFVVGEGCDNPTIQSAVDRVLGHQKTGDYVDPFIGIINSHLFNEKVVIDGTGTTRGADIRIIGGFSNCSTGPTGPDQKTIISAGGSQAGNSVIEIKNSKNLNLIGFHAHVELSNLILTAATGAGDGGGVNFHDNITGQLVLSNVDIQNNVVNSQGGGIFVGGGTAISSSAPPVLFTFNGGSVRQNEAVNGGGVALAGLVQATLTNVVLHGNTANNDGGGIFVDAAAQAIESILLDSGTLVQTNTAFEGGGVFLSNGAQLVMNKGFASIQGNSASNGGGVLVTSGSRADIASGGVPAVDGNTANVDGGGMFVRDSGVVRLFSIAPGVLTQISNNHAPNGRGGGIFVDAQNSGHTFGALCGFGYAITGNDAIHGAAIGAASSGDGLVSGRVSLTLADRDCGRVPVINFGAVGCSEGGAPCNIIDDNTVDNRLIFNDTAVIEANGDFTADQVEVRRNVGDLIFDRENKSNALNLRVKLSNCLLADNGVNIALLRAHAMAMDFCTVAGNSINGLTINGFLDPDAIDELRSSVLHQPGHLLINFPQDGVSNVVGVISSDPPPSWAPFAEWLQIDPQFSDATNRDYHLRAGSPAIDHSALAFGPDLENNARGFACSVSATPFDAGAYEFPCVNTITFTSSAPSNAAIGDTYRVSATSSAGLPVALTIDVTSGTVCTISNGVVSLIGAGACTIDANQGGSGSVPPAAQIQQSFGVNGKLQTITFTSSAPTGAFVGDKYNVAATSDSGLIVGLKIDATSATVCGISNGVVSFVAAGTCTIDANQGGDTVFSPAAQVQQSVVVSKISQTISFTSSAPSSARVGQTYLVTASATSGLSVQLRIDAASSGVCTIQSNMVVTFTGVGTCTINANQFGNTTFAQAPQVQQSVNVTGTTPQTITFTSTAPTNAVVGGVAYIVTATADSGLPVSFTIDNAPSTVCAISGNTVTFIGAGDCTIDANQGGDATFAPAAQVQQVVVVGTNSSTLSPFAIGDGLVVNAGASTSVVNGALTSVLANDFNPNANAFGQQMTSAIVSNPSHGALLLNLDGAFTYQNNGDAASSDSFQYKACDSVNGALCAVATVTITVVPVGEPLPTVQLPQAVNDAATVNSGASTSVLFDGSTTVLVNDLDPNTGGHLLALEVQAPSHGDLLFNEPVGSFTYTNQGGDPATADGFYYQACDSLYGACSLATVTITVVPPGQPLPTVLLPIAVDDAIQVVPGGTTNVLIGNATTVLWNDTDPNGGLLTASLLGAGAEHGDLTFDAGAGTFVYSNHPADPATSDSFSYQACDSIYGVCATATVSISITNSAVLNQLPTPAPDTINVLSGGTANVLVGGATSVLANDTDPDAEETATLQAFLLGSGPQHGGIVFNSDGSFVYTNRANDPATSDSFVYEACDVHGACTAETVTIAIGNASNPTVTCLLSTQVNLAGAVSFDGTTDVVSIDMSKLFAPPGGDTLTYSESGLPSSLSVNANTGLLVGTFGANDHNGSPYIATLTATSVPFNTTASETVQFVVLDPNDHIFRHGFDGLPQRCQ